MAQTLGHASQSTVLLEHLKQQYRAGSYVYKLSRAKDQISVAVSHGGESQSANLQWAFGSAQVGQSYLWLNGDGTFREARFNYFASLDTFAATPGRLHGEPVGVDMALGRHMDGFEAKTCFGCHTTGLTTGSALDETGFTPGISCEACHGPGTQHVAAMRSGAATGAESNLHILNPSRMTPVQSVDLCGSCHSTPWDVRIMGATGKATVRFPAYRLEKSRCWGTTGDARLVCQSCHDPHAPLERNATSYDPVCLGCHATGQQVAVSTQHPGSVCPVAKSKCTTCHMQKYEVTEMHSNFTDHMIRIVRPNASVPD